MPKVFRHVSSRGTKPVPDSGAVAGVKRTHVFICGLHRSGTSILNKMIQSHPDITGFSGTGASEDEGQHLQTVLPHDGKFGGPGEFCFDPRVHLTERDFPRYAGQLPLIKQAWELHWDDSMMVRVEKSPPNLIRSRFLQASFPDARFIFIVRHPIVVAMATQKWSESSIETLISHWIAGHRIMLEDTAHLNCLHVVRYEDIACAPVSALSHMWEFIGVDAFNIDGSLFQSRNTSYLDRFQHLCPLNQSLLSEDVTSIFRRFAYTLDAPYSQDVGVWTFHSTGGR